MHPTLYDIAISFHIIIGSAALFYTCHSGVRIMTKTSPINQHGQYRKTIIDNKTVQGRNACMRVDALSTFITAKLSSVYVIDSIITKQITYYSFPFTNHHLLCRSLIRLPLPAVSVVVRKLAASLQKLKQHVFSS